MHHVLVIDGYQPQSDVWRLFLTSAGVKVSTALTAGEALLKLRADTRLNRVIFDESLSSDLRSIFNQVDDRRLKLMPFDRSLDAPDKLLVEMLKFSLNENEKTTPLLKEAW